jgi:hypothetical protein
MENASGRSLNAAMIARTLTASLALAPMVVGCARPGVDIGASANVKLDQPVPLRLDQPIEVRVLGLAVEYEGTFITEQLFNMVQTGSSAEYARAVYGKPDVESVLKDGSAVWKYHFRPTSSQGSVLGLLGGKKEDEPKPEHVITLVFIKDEKVTGKWRG